MTFMFLMAIFALILQFVAVLFGLALFCTPVYALVLILLPRRQPDMPWRNVLVGLAGWSMFTLIMITSALYYLAELVEEYTVAAKYVITWMVFTSIVFHIGLLIFEDMPLYMNALGVFQQLLHGLLLRDFPSVKVTSVTFVTATLTLVTNHYVAFKYFGEVYHPFNEILAYFTLCMWLVPFALFVSLSANDNVLPTTGETQPLLGDSSNVLTDYLSRKSKRYSLLSFFNFAKESLLPERNKKTF